MKIIFVLIVLVFCLRAEVVEQVYYPNVENKTTLSFYYKGGLKQEIRPIDENGYIISLNINNFKQLIEQSSKFYLRYKVFPLNQRDKCYANLDINANTVPVLIHNRECLEIRSKSVDFIIKAVKVLFIMAFVLPLLGLIINILLLFFLSISKYLGGNSAADSDK